MWQSQNQQQSQVHHYYADPNQQQQQYYPQQNPPYPVQQQVFYPPQQQQTYYPTNNQPPPVNTSQPVQQLNMDQSEWAERQEMNTEFQFDDQSIRKSFIRKVFSILSVQLSITTGIIAIFVFIPAVQQFAFQYFWLAFVAIGVTFLLMIMLVCCESLRRNSPTNYIILFIFTLCMAFMLGLVSATYERFEVILAVGITVAVTVGLTIFALQTKWDFTTMGGVLFVSVLILMIFGIFAAIFRNNTLTLVYASIGALLFCIYLVYDIQLMMGGKHKYSISPEEYIFAALNLYIDIVNIFMYILMIIGAARN